MINKIDRRTFYSYLMFGFSAFIIEYILFALLLSLGTFLLVAQSFSFAAGLLVSFFGNRKVTFNKQNSYALSKASQLWRYLTLAIINLLLSNIVIHILVDYINIEPLFAKVMVMVCIVGWNYVLFNKVIFRSTQS